MVKRRVESRAVGWLLSGIVRHSETSIAEVLKKKPYLHIDVLTIVDCLVLFGASIHCIPIPVG